MSVDEFSVSSPVVALCELGTAELENCELGSEITFKQGLDDEKFNENLSV